MSGIADLRRDSAVPRDGRRTRVVAMIDTQTVSGPGRQLAALAGAITPLGIDLHVVTFQRDGAPASEYPAFLRSAGVEHSVVRDGGRFDAGVIGRIRDLLRELGPDIMQSHSYRPAFIARVLRATGSPRPWIAFFHGVTHEDRKVRLYNWLDRHLISTADRIVVMADAQRRLFPGQGERVLVVHNAVVQAPETYQQPAVVLPPAAGRPRIGCIGRLSPEKGIDVLLDALPLLHRDGHAAHLVIAGDGLERAALEARAQRLGLGAHVHFLGPVHPISGLYPQLDVVAIPSRTEGLPNVLLEALSADRPVVCTPVGAIPEVISEPAAGHLVPVGDAPALARALAAALDGGTAPDARAARRRAVEAFSLETRARTHAGLYASLLGARA